MIHKKNIKDIFWLSVYYGIARYAPPSHANIFGRIGGYLRRLCAFHLFKYCAKDANIEHMAYFGDGHSIELGSKSGIGVHCHVPNNIKIGNNVMMGPYCYIIGNTTHNYERIDIPIIDQGSRFVKERTIIGDDVWIGRQCIMITGKKIGSHSIIGAGSVICKDIPDYVVAAGNPIRVVKNRK